MWPFKLKTKSYLGIDIGTSSVKMVQLSRTREKITLENYGELQTYGYLEKLNDPLQTKSLKMLEKIVVSLAKAVIKEATIEAKNVAMSLPIFSGFVTVMDLPPMSEKELISAVPFEARRYVPIPLNEVRLDWRIIESVPLAKKEGGSPASKIKVLLVAVPKTVIQEYARIAQILDLKLLTLELESFSIVRSLVGNDKSAICILDIGSRSSDFTIVDRGFIRMSHSFPTAGEDLTKVLSARMNIAFEKAEKIKRTSGLKETEAIDDETRRILFITVDQIAAEAERMITGYLEKENRRVEKLILAGGSANLLGLKEYLAEKLAITVSMADPWARMMYPPFIKPALSEIGPALSVAVGLGMGEL